MRKVLIICFLSVLALTSLNSCRVNGAGHYYFTLSGKHNVAKGGQPKKAKVNKLAKRGRVYKIKRKRDRRRRYKVMH